MVVADAMCCSCGEFVRMDRWQRVAVADPIKH